MVKRATNTSITVEMDVDEAHGGTGQSTWTQGDIPYSDATDSLAKLGKGTASQTLKMNSGATAPEWVTNDETEGGTGQTSYTQGDVLYSDATDSLAKLGKGTEGQAFSMGASNIPAWSVGGTWGAELSKTTDYTILDADMGKLVYLSSSATADTVFTLNTTPSNKDTVWVCNQDPTVRLTVEDNGGTDLVYLYLADGVYKFTYSTIMAAWSIANA